MVSANTRVMNGLMELLEVVSEVLIHKGLPIVTQISLGDDTMVSTMLFKGLLGSQGGMGVQTGLEFNEHHPRGMVHKDATTHVLLVITLFTIGVEQMTTWVAVEVVH